MEILKKISAGTGALLLTVPFIGAVGSIPAYAVDEYVYESQTLSVVSTATGAVSRDGVTVSLVYSGVHVPVDSSSAGPGALSFAGASYSSLVESALAHMGAGMDCTALVERALQGIGVNVGDVGPMGFSGAGYVFSDPGSVQPGDILMRGGHVSIYIGNGMAVHGGYNGRVAVAEANPLEYVSFVRVG